MIALGAALYAVSTILFIFPNEILLGGTSGIAVILSNALPLSAGDFSVIMNASLIVLAFVFLGRGMAAKTLVGSLLATVFIGLGDKIITLHAPVLTNDFLAAIAGASIIAVASGIMFYVDSSSGGTDIVALILRKFIHINIGRALFVSDVLIVIIGGVISGLMSALSSILGFIIKVFGIDLVIFFIRKYTLRKFSKNAKKQ